MSFSPSDLHVVVAVHNPLRFESRARLFGEFYDRMKAAGVQLTVVDAAFGDRKHEHTAPTPCHANPRHVQVRQRDELWVKESLLNIGMARLPDDWEYAAWIDGDVDFLRPDWATETVHALQHHPVVQMWQSAVDLGPTGETLGTFESFAYSWVKGRPLKKSSYYGDAITGRGWHPGFAWAIRRDALDEVGGLLDWSILGSGDRLMALGIIGEIGLSIPEGMHPNFHRHAAIWQERAAAFGKNLGYVPGSLLHHWHGPKKSRHYDKRWQVLVEHQFDPERDVRRDSQGLVQLTQAGERMRRDLMVYFRSRNEDSVDNQ